MRMPSYSLVRAALVVSLVGCAPTQQARKVEMSGFLVDYSQLREGEGDEAQLVYVDCNADWASYDKVLIEPVRILTEGGRKSAFSDVTPEDLQMLADYLHTAIRDQLQKDYQIVDERGPGVIRIRCAITEAQGSKVLLDTMSNVLLPAIAISTVKRLATGTHTAVGEAGVEAELLDGQTGKRLAAAVDRRAGAKVLRGKFGTWNDVKEAYNYWAERLRNRLAEERARPK